MRGEGDNEAQDPGQILQGPAGVMRKVLSEEGGL